MDTYDAFISYSHSRDQRIAAALQTALQRIGQARFKGTSLRVFRDNSSLSAAPSLWGTIETALAQSRFFILLASPESAASPWVDREVAYWLEHKPRQTLLIGLTAGALDWDERTGDFDWNAHTPLPPALKGVFASEPKWIDLRACRKWRSTEFGKIAAEFAAPVRGVPKEALWSLELSQARRERWRKRLAVCAFLAIGIFGVWQWKEAVLQRYRAQQSAPPETGAIQIGLPTGPATPGPVPSLDNAVVLSMTRDLTLWIGTERIERESLAAALGAATHDDKTQTIYLRVDRTVAYDEITRLLGAVHAAGYQKVAMVVQAAEKTSD